MHEMEIGRVGLGLGLGSACHFVLCAQVLGMHVVSKLSGCAVT
jgi:hypothetical protein